MHSIAAIHVSTLSHYHCKLHSPNKQMDAIKTGKWRETAITHNEINVELLWTYTGNDENTTFRTGQNTWLCSREQRQRTTKKTLARWCQQLDRLLDQWSSKICKGQGRVEKCHTWYQPVNWRMALDDVYCYGINIILFQAHALISVTKVSSNLVSRCGLILISSVTSTEPFDADHWVPEDR